MDMDIDMDTPPDPTTPTVHGESRVPGDTAWVLPWLPPGRTLSIAGRGEFYVRHYHHPDPSAPTVLLLHGWTASSDLQFFTAYEGLAATCSFVGVDHRGHGRGLRTPQPFTLEDAADDAAIVLHELGIDSAIVVGYSMGGPISMLLARRHPQLVAGLVVQATALEWNHNWRERLQWKWLPVMGTALRSRFARGFMKRFLEKTLADGHPLEPMVPWLRGESQRADANAVVEAGAALSRYDATPWASALEVPAAMLITTNDRLVRPHKQRALAKALNAQVREMATDHLGPWEAPDQFSSLTVELVGLVAGAASVGVPSAASVATAS